MIIRKHLTGGFLFKEKGVTEQEGKKITASSTQAWERQDNSPWLAAERSPLILANAASLPCSLLPCQISGVVNPTGFRETVSWSPKGKTTFHVKQRKFHKCYTPQQEHSRKYCSQMVTC